MPFITRDDASIYYETLGSEGPWLTLVNGHTRSSRDFRLLAGQLSKQGIRCLLFDNRGSGDTQSPSGYSLETIADDICALWDQLGVQQSVVMGLSMGGLISQVLTHKMPDRVLGLILVSTGSSESSLAPLASAPWGTTEESVFQKLQAYFTETFLERNRLLAQAMAKQILQGIANERFEQRTQEQRDAMRGIDTRPWLREFRCPVLIIHGSDDRIIPHTAAIELQQLIPGARLLTLPGVGHLVLAEYSKNLGQSVISFIRDHGWS